MFFAVVFMSTLKSGTTDINLALNKVATYCGKVIASSKVVDGNKSLENTERIIGGCEEYSYIDVQLGAPYYVHYVVVYEGLPGEHKGSLGQLDYFWVENMDSDGGVKLCSKYPSRSIGPKFNQGMRVNCEVGLSSAVRIRSNFNIGFNIAEIEVFTIASGAARENVMIHHGCSKSFTSFEISTISQFKHCLSLCSKRFAFAGIMSARECHCGKFEKDASFVPTESCNLKCQGKRCGGDSVFSVYIVSLQLPFNSGCRTEKGLEGVTISGDMTLNKCLYECKAYHIATIKNGDECLCLSWAFNIKFDEYDLCSMPCTGEPKTSCGGRKYASIYKTGSIMDKIHWLERLRCKNWNEFGVCTSSCYEGFRGIYCLESDVSDVLDGDKEVGNFLGAPKILCHDPSLCKDKPNMQCVLDKGSPKCECSPGYAQQVLKETCIDLDECLFGPCDVRSSTCENVPGTYECPCLSGFYRLTKDVCQSNRSDKLLPDSLLNYLPSLLYVLIPLVGAAVSAVFAFSMAPAPTDEETRSGRNSEDVQSTFSEGDD